MSTRILVIDDSDFTAIYLEGLLGDTYSLVHQESGEAGVAAATANPPDIILMDVEMPGMDGYAACRLIKQSPATHEIPIIFLSARVEPADRLAGYEAGGDDYVTKPFDPDELTRKIEVLLRNRAKNRELAEQAQVATSTAMTAMSSVGDLGIIMRFLGEMVSCLDFPSVAACILRTMDNFGLDTSLQLRHGEEKLSRSREGICSPLEESILGNMASCARIVDLGTRSAFNFPRVSIIVRDMPKNNPEHYGRIKDNLATIVESVDVHLQSLAMIDGALKRGDTLLRMLQSTIGTLRSVDERYRRQRVASSEILNNLVADIEDSFVNLGLTDGQERMLQDLVRNASERAQALYSAEIEVDQTMQALNANLDSVLQQEIQGACQAPANPEDRIELF